MNNIESVQSKETRTLRGDIDRLVQKYPKTARSIAIAAIAGAVLTGEKAISHNFSTPAFSSETTEYTIQPGDGLLDAAAEISGLGDDREGVAYIENMPENQDALSDGLQPGETIIIPISANK